MTDVSGEQSKTKQDGIRLLKTSHNFKLMNCLFLELFFEYFQIPVECEKLKPQKIKLQIREDYSSYILSCQGPRISTQKLGREVGTIQTIIFAFDDEEGKGG